MRLRTVLVLPALAGLLIPCAAAAQVSPRPRSIPRFERAKQQADASLPRAARAAAPTPRTQLFSNLNFAGLSAGENEAWAGYTPPDSTGAIGPNHYVELVNSRIGIWPAAGGAAAVDEDLQTFINDQGPVVLVPGVDHDNPGDSIFDVQVQWDTQSDRFLIAADDVEESGKTHLVFGWSKSDNPTTGWCIYRTEPAQVRFEDYPKLGHDDGYLLIGTNEFLSSSESSSFAGSKLWAFPTPSSAPITTACPAAPAAVTGGAQSVSQAFTPVAANVADSGSGRVVATPLSGAQDHLLLYTVTSGAIGPPTSIAVRSWSVPPNVQQPGTTHTLDSQDGRLTQAVAHADPDASGHEAIWTQHTVKSADGTRTDVRWYELDAVTRTKRQEGEITDLSNSVFNAAVSPAMDGTTAAINYNVGGRFHVVQIRAQTRASATSANRTVNEFRLGTSSNVDADFTCFENPTCRWGDYAGASPDPTNTSVAWGTNQLNGTQSADSPAWITRNFALTFGGADPRPDTSADDPSPFISASPQPAFNFASSETGSTFQCSLDGSAFSSCVPGAPFGPALPNGVHTLRVFAIDAAGQADLSPAQENVTINAPLPDTAIDAGPPASTFTRSASFAFHGTKAGSTFQCSFDGSAFAGCASPFSATKLGLGTHTFAVRSIDTLGNVDPTPATSSFAVAREPSAVVAARTQRASRKGTIKLRVRCPAVRITTCSGSVTVQVASTHRKLGSARFRVRPGRTATVRVKLTHRSFKLLKQKKRLRVRALFRLSSPAKRITKTFRLSAPRTRRS